MVLKIEFSGTTAISIPPDKPGPGGSKVVPGREAGKLPGAKQISGVDKRPAMRHEQTRRLLVHCIKIRICKQYTLNLQKYVNCKSPWRIKQKRENVARHTKKSTAARQISCVPARLTMSSNASSRGGHIQPRPDILCLQEPQNIRPKNLPRPLPAQADILSSQDLNNLYRSRPFPLGGGQLTLCDLTCVL